VIVLMSTRGAAEMEAPGMEAGTEPLRALFERQYRPMVRLAELLLADRASAEDVTQEAFAASTSGSTGSGIPRRPVPTSG